MNPTGIERHRKLYNPVQRDAGTFLETSEETGGERTLVELEVAPGAKVTPHLPPRIQRALHRDRRPIDRGDRRRPSRARPGRPGRRGSRQPARLEQSGPAAQRRPRGAATRKPGFERSLRIVYGLAADGLVLKNGVPRNPLHAALLLDMGEVRLPGAYAALERVMALLARLARRRGIDRELERRYL